MHARVTAVLVVQHGGDRLRRTLDALDRQTRRPDEFAFVLLAVDDETRRNVEAGHPDHVVALGEPRSFGEAVAIVERGMPEPRDDELLWLLPEDAAPEPEALESLVAALGRARSAVIAAPKLVRWDDPRRIVRFGRTTTRTGRSVAVVEDELDQGQHDDLADVLGADPAGLLIRRTTWRALGGFDPALPVIDDGLDLGVRARLAGHRVIAVPEARVRFADSGVAGPGSEPGGRAARRRARRARAARLHRRLVAGPPALAPLNWLLLLPLAVLRSLRHLLVKTPGAIPGEFAAAVEVMARPQRVVRSRAAIRRTRTARWSSLAPLRMSGDEVRERRQQAAEARRQRARGRADDLMFLQTGGGWVVLVTAAASLLLFAPIIASGGVSGGGLLPLSGDVGVLWRNAATGWRDIAGGFEGAADPFAGVLAVLGTSTFWAPSTALLVLWLVALPLSGLGGWFAASRLTERAALRVVAGLAWAVAPPLLDALSAGRPAAVVAHVLLPWLAVLMFAAATSWAAAAAASLVFAAVVACAPSLAPALLLAWIVSLPLSGRAAVRLAGIPLPALALFLPLVVQQFTRGAPLSLLADPGVPQPAAEPTALALALGQASGWGRWSEPLAALGGVASPAIVLAVLLAPLVLAACAVVATRRSRSGLLGLALAAIGFATAVAATTIQVAFAGDRAVPVWTGAALSLMWMGLIAAALLALGTLRRGSAALAALVMAGVLLAVAPSLAALALGRSAVGPATARTLPAFVEAEAAADPRVGTLRIRPTADGGLRATVERGPGATLDEQSTLASTQRMLTGRTEENATLAGNLASRSGYDATGAVDDLGLAFVLLAPATEDPRAVAVEQRARAALDGNAQVASVGETEFGPLWRFADAEPGPAVPPPSPLARWIVAGQILVVGAAVLLSIPTGGGREPDRRPASVRRRRRRGGRGAGSSDHAGEGDVGPDDAAPRADAPQEGAGPAAGVRSDEDLDPADDRDPREDAATDRESTPDAAEASIDPDGARRAAHVGAPDDEGGDHAGEA